MSIKVERKLHDMRILGRIVEVRSTEQFVRHLLTPTSLQFCTNNTPRSFMLKGTGSISLRRHDSMEKDTRTEFEKMEW